MYPACMDVREMARLGGLARTSSMTPEERRALALKASRAAAKARTEKARAKKKFAPLGNLAKELKKSLKRQKAKVRR